jgi:hypothetical protein
MHSTIHGRNVVRSARFEQDLPAGFQQPPHERMYFQLQERLSASDFNERAIDCHRTIEYLVNWHPLALLKGMRRIAPPAPGVADGQADENTRQPGKGRFALQAAINLVNQ